jgi:hypothetical protein
MARTATPNVPSRAAVVVDINITTPGLSASIIISRTDCGCVAAFQRAIGITIMMAITRINVPPRGVTGDVKQKRFQRKRWSGTGDNQCDRENKGLYHSIPLASHYRSGAEDFFTFEILRMGTNAQGD